MTAPLDFVVNSTPIGDTYSPFGPSVTTLADGRALVVWVSAESAGFSDGEVRGRWLNADGSFAGEDFIVNTTSRSFQVRPVATATADGRVFLAWESGDGADGDGVTLRGIVLDPDLPDTATDFLLNSVRDPVEQPLGPSNQQQVTLTALADGGVFALWTSYDNGDADGLTIRGRRFDADGQPLGDDMVINSTGAGSQYLPDALQLADGRIFVTWSSFESAVLGTSFVRGRMLAADGTPLGDDMVLNGAADLFPYAPDVVQLADGRMLATWYSSGPIVFTPGENPNVDPGTIRAQMLDENGLPVGEAYDVSSTPLETSNSRPTAVVLPDGLVFVAWYSGDGGDGDWGCLRGRLLNAEGRPVASDFVLNSTPFNLNGNPDLSVLPDGRVLVVWSDEGDFGADAVTRALYLTPLVGSDGDETLAGSDGQDMMMGLGGDDDLVAAGGHDQLAAGGGNDTLAGEAGQDMLSGGRGNDHLTGGVGADTLTGGAGADVFAFDSDAVGTGRDLLMDMGARDVIDLSGLLAGAKGNGASFIGSADFDAAAQVRQAGDRVLVDLDGDGRADFILRLGSEVTLTADHFLL